MEIRGQGDPSGRSGGPCGASTVQGQPDLPLLGRSFRRGRGGQAQCEIATSVTATTQYLLVHFSVTLCLALKRIFGIGDHATLNRQPGPQRIICHQHPDGANKRRNTLRLNKHPSSAFLHEVTDAPTSKAISHAIASSSGNPVAQSRDL